jgi:hypothetical protein
MIFRGGNVGNFHMSKLAMLADLSRKVMDVTVRRGTSMVPVLHTISQTNCKKSQKTRSINYALGDFMGFSMALSRSNDPKTLSVFLRALSISAFR